MPVMRRSSPGRVAPPILPHSTGSSVATLRSLLVYLWPAHDIAGRARFVIAMGLLLLAKLATVYVPLVYARIIDALAPVGPTIASRLPAGTVKSMPLRTRRSGR